MNSKIVSSRFLEPHHGVPYILSDDTEDIFFSVQRLHGFRQVVQHVSRHVAYEIN